MQQIRLNQPIIVGLDTSGQPSYVRALVARIVRLTDISEATGATIVIQVGYASKLDPAMEVAAFFGLSEYPVTFAPGPDLGGPLARRCVHRDPVRSGCGDGGGGATHGHRRDGCPLKTGGTAAHPEHLRGSRYDPRTTCNDG